MKIKFDTKELVNDKLAINIIHTLSNLTLDDTKTLNNDENKDVLKLKEENDTLLDEIGNLKSKLDTLKYEYETSKNTVNIQENKLLKLKEENKELKEKIEELTLVINEKDKFIEKEINKTTNEVNKDAVIEDNTDNIEKNVVIEDNTDTKDIKNVITKDNTNNNDTNNIENVVTEDNTNNTENEDKNNLIAEFKKFNENDRNIINELIKFNEIKIQGKKDYLKYKVYPLSSYFKEYQDAFRKSEYKKATKKSVALFTLNEFEHRFPKSVDYIIKKEQLVFNKYIKGSEIFEKVDYITKLISMAVNLVHFNIIKTDDKTKLSEDDLKFKLVLLYKDLYKLFENENIDITKENITKHIDRYFNKYIELFEHTIDIKIDDDKYEYNEYKYNELVDNLYDKLKTKFNEDNTFNNNDEDYDENKEFDDNSNDYSVKFEEFKKSINTVGKVDLSSINWSDLDTFEKFNNNFVNKYHRFGSIWKSNQILNELNLPINYFENIKNYNNDEYFNYVCSVFKEVQNTNVN
jgi:hypothetical protein